ncbi:hypothetical protein ILUMI_25182 [Ignelater luminosus]|uniref:Intraflagellar transport protein 43 homolog n=1 Tax=Ignelater luminosus TaxID=2038154 RepID=A0A8K0FZW4_IGNLU|nr:hypothetical protein ILUMI_25182 [Ignelater luminosus]
MNWDEDIDLLAGKKPVAKQGRRAGNPRSPDSTEQLLDSALESITNASPRDGTTQPRKTGGWADDGIRSAKSRGNLIEEQRFQEQTILSDDDDDDIPIIPDIDDIQEDIQSPNEIKTPTILINTSTYKELDKELSAIQASPTAMQSLTKANGINLSLLTKRLCPEKDIKESDEEWTLESLFNDLIALNTAI